MVEAALISRTQRLENALLDVEPRVWLGGVGGERPATTSPHRVCPVQVMTLLRQLPTRLTATALEELRLSKQALVRGSGLAR